MTPINCHLDSKVSCNKKMDSMGGKFRENEFFSDFSIWGNMIVPFFFFLSENA